MLIATAVLGMSVYQTAILEPITASHLTAALTAQGISAEGAMTARALLLDALGPAGGQGTRTYKCTSFDVTLERATTSECRSFRMTVSGMLDARIQGTLCPRPDGSWGEAPGRDGLVSVPLDRRWRDMILKTGAALYREPGLQSFHSRSGAQNLMVQVGGYDYREAQTFAYVRLPNGDTRYVLKDDLVPEPTAR